jgi:hypothetical protein
MFLPFLQLHNQQQMTLAHLSWFALKPPLLLKLDGPEWGDHPEL